MNNIPGVIRLEEMMGSDLAIVNNARASLDKATDWDNEDCRCGVKFNGFDYLFNPICTDGKAHSFDRRLSNRDEAILRSLAKNRHGSPFERVVFTFHVETNIGVSREWFRHRIASYNEMSTRYMDMKDELDNCYIPIGDAVRRNAGKIMSYEMEVITDPETIAIIQERMIESYTHSFKTYEFLMATGLSREVARNVLPLGMRTAFYVTMNLRSAFNFMSLRNSKQALYEIRYIAAAMETLISSVVPIAYDAWATDCNRIPI